MILWSYAVLANLSVGYPPSEGTLSTRYSPVRHSTRSRRNFLVRLACIRRATSVCPEPESNSPLKSEEPSLTQSIKTPKRCFLLKPPEKFSRVLKTILAIQFSKNWEQIYNPLLQQVNCFCTPKTILAPF